MFECLLSFIYNYSTRSKYHNVRNRIHSTTIRKSAILQVCGLYIVCEIIRGLYRKVIVLTERNKLRYKTTLLNGLKNFSGLKKFFKSVVNSLNGGCELGFIILGGFVVVVVVVVE